MGPPEANIKRCPAPVGAKHPLPPAAKEKSGQGKALSYGETALKKESRKALFSYSAPSGILAIIVLYTCRKNSSVRISAASSEMG